MQSARKKPRLIYHTSEKHQEHEKKMHYYHLAAMIGAHFVIMYALMYLMVNSFSDVFLNANNLYMSAAMAAPMAILMLLFMKSMYQNARLNVAVYVISAAMLTLFILFARQQTFVGNEEFVKSMIPHHSGAILMCREASISDAELQTLCGKIIQSQQEEIAQMKMILTRLRGQ